MERGYSLTSIENLRGSVLREFFESSENFQGEFTRRSIDLNKVTDKIVNLEQRPEFSPNIQIIQIREVTPILFYVFNEMIYTSNKFLDGLEEFLRANLVSVPARNFDEVPKEYKHFFNTPYSLVPIEITVPRYKNRIEKVIYGQFKGVDFDSSCTLKMVEPETLNNRLEQIEKAGNFSVVIEKTRGIGDKEILFFEYRMGNEHQTVNHLVFAFK